MVQYFRSNCKISKFQLLLNATEIPFNSTAYVASYLSKVSQCSVVRRDIRFLPPKNQLLSGPFQTAIWLQQLLPFALSNYKAGMAKAKLLSYMIFLDITRAIRRKRPGLAGQVVT